MGGAPLVSKVVITLHCPYALRWWYTSQPWLFEEAVAILGPFRTLLFIYTDYSLGKRTQEKEKAPRIEFFPGSIARAGYGGGA